MYESSFFLEKVKIFSVASETCPEGWSYREGKCYYASTSWETWHNAIAKCKEIEGEATLVSWHSQDEVDYLQS
jgi:hypothetical protein